MEKYFCFKQQEDMVDTLVCVRRVKQEASEEWDKSMPLPGDIIEGFVENNAYELLSQTERKQQIGIKANVFGLSKMAPETRSQDEEVHKWLYKCNQYFDLEEIPETDKLKLASYYLDGLELYWHQNYTKNLEGHEVTWVEYVDALCCWFGDQKDPLEELIEHKHEGDLEGYIRDFDMLWNRAQISKKQALVFFLGGLEIVKRT
ncbi:hypothetical protein NC652_039424 [Populus alba x Populus x berolinensis]|nr:hypothetical protein NC652_039424 [Populus alba x Populus x berolinensis]